MIRKLFIFIHKKTSFAFTVALFSTTWSWMASFYGFYFVYATVNITPGEFEITIKSLVFGTAAAVIGHWIHFGVLFKFGITGFSRSLRTINTCLNDRYIFKNHTAHSADEIEALYFDLLRFPRINMNTALVCTYAVIGILIVSFLLNSPNWGKILFIVIGGIVASLLIGYFTFIITEYFIGPYKVRLEQILFSKRRTVYSRNILDFKVKTIFMIFLVIFSMILLTILLRRSDKPLVEIYGFIILSVLTIGTLIYLSINTISVALATINTATSDLASGGSGMYFPPFSDKEFVQFSQHYNRAAIEINGIRANLQERIEERTDQLNQAYQILNRAYSQIQSDLQLAKRIQRSIVSEEFDVVKGITIKVGYYPIADVGGDIYIINCLNDSTMRIFLADAIGHGIQAALVTMIIKSEFEKFKNLGKPDELLGALNQSFLELYSTLSAFFSCIVIDLDLDSMQLSYASAGHPDQMLLHADELHLLRHTGKLIGITRDSSYVMNSVPISVNDKMLLYTDGLFEQINNREEVYSESKVLDIVSSNRMKSVHEIMDVVLEDIKQFIGDHSDTSFTDDITLIGIHIGR